MYRKLLIHSCYILIICNSKCPGEAVVVLNANLRWCDGDNLFDSFSPEVSVGDSRLDPRSLM